MKKILFTITAIAASASVLAQGIPMDPMPMPAAGAITPCVEGSVTTDASGQLLCQSGMWQGAVKSSPVALQTAELVQINATLSTILAEQMRARGASASALDGTRYCYHDGKAY